MEERELMVEIPIERYEELLDIESRVNTATDLVLADKDIKLEVLLRVIGTGGMIDVADRIRKADEEFWQRLKEKEKEKENGN